MMGIEMTKSKKPKPIVMPSAVPPTETVRVSHPRLEGHTETVKRVIDTIDAMRKRKQISEREYQAADRYRTAFDTLGGVMGGVGDYERSRGGGTPGKPPAPTYLLAGELVTDVRKYLYPQDYAIVYRVCALGMTIEEAAQQLYDPVTRAVREDAGRRLREGLSQLADRWFPIQTKAPIRSTIMERAGVTDVQHVSQARAVHATANKVFRSGK